MIFYMELLLSHHCEPSHLEIPKVLQNALHVLPQPVPCHFMLRVPILRCQWPAAGFSKPGDRDDPFSDIRGRGRMLCSFWLHVGSFSLPFLSESLKARFSGNAAHDVHNSLSANMNCRQCLPVVIYIVLGHDGPCNLPADVWCQPQSGKHHGPKIWQRYGLCVLGQDKDQNIALFLVDESWAIL